jgi:hypothetical protein
MAIENEVTKMSNSNLLGPKYPKATKCLKKDRDALLTFYDFPAEYWRHIRTTNPIESTFSTVKRSKLNPPHTQITSTAHHALDTNPLHTSMLQRQSFL